MSDLIIDDSNFSQYFRDVLVSKPQKGDVLACYKAVAELIDGDLKEQVVEALFVDKIGANKAVSLMTKLGKAPRKEAIKLVKTIAMDLYNGMQKHLVLAKAYEYMFEIFYYTKEEYVPKDDHHWEIIRINNIDEFLSKSTNISNEGKKISTEAVCKE